MSGEGHDPLNRAAHPEEWSKLQAERVSKDWIVMREMGCLFMVLTFVAGITVSTVPVALINVVVFFALSLGLVHFLGDRLGKQGLAFGLFATFFASFAWPFALAPFLGEEGCEGDQCMAWIFTTPGAQMAEEQPEEAQCPPGGCRMIAPVRPDDEEVF